MTNQVHSAMTKQPVSIAPDVKLLDAYEIMRSWGMRHLPVTDSKGTVVGLLSERDVLRHMAIHPGQKAALVSDAMSANPYTVNGGARLADVAQTMAEQKIGCAVVVGQNGLSGIFTTTDALKILAQLLRDDDGEPFKLIRIEEYLESRSIA